MKPEQYISHVCKGLLHLYIAKATLKRKKCSLITDTTDYLDHVIILKRLELRSQTTDAIRGLKPTTSLANMSSFLGLWNVYRRFVPNYTIVATSPGPTTEENPAKNICSARHHRTKTMNTLKNALI